MRKRFVLPLLLSALIFGNNLQKGYVNTASAAERQALTLDVTSGPVSKELMVNFSAAENGTSITITDLKGEKLISLSIESGSSKANINVSRLTSGTYFVVLTSGGSRTSKLFVKQ